LWKVETHNVMSLSKRILVKIGSNVLTLSSGLPDEIRIGHLVRQISELKKEGYEVLLVSSGAVAAGRGILETSLPKLDKVSQKQVLASIGKIELMNLYLSQFQKHQLHCSQVLVTKESFRTRKHYLNIKNCLEALLASNVTPIINENDVVSITELMFTDNDELSGLVASMMNVESLFLLTNVDGIFTAHPKEKGAKLIRTFEEGTIDLEHAVSEIKSEFGRGGMLSKATTAQEIANLGIDVYIGNGTKDTIIKDLIVQETGTFFQAKNRSTTPIKKWVARSGGHSDARIIVNEGTKEALHSSKANSLLPVGVQSIEGSFKQGDVVSIFDNQNNAIGLGKVAYGSEEAIEVLGKRAQTPLIHYNYLVLN
jgi:glutamate 5-kinase